MCKDSNPAGAPKTISGPDHPSAEGLVRSCPTLPHEAQATFGASQSDIDALKALTPSGSINPSRYRTWIDNQLALPTNSLTVPDVLANLSSNTMFPYQNTMFWNSWWKNAMTGSDQLRQRFAFALTNVAAGDAINGQVAPHQSGGGRLVRVAPQSETIRGARELRGDSKAAR